MKIFISNHLSLITYFSKGIFLKLIVWVFPPQVKQLRVILLKIKMRLTQDHSRLYQFTRKHPPPFNHLAFLLANRDLVCVHVSIELSNRDLVCVHVYKKLLSHDLKL